MEMSDFEKMFMTDLQKEKIKKLAKKYGINLDGNRNLRQLKEYDEVIHYTDDKGKMVEIVIEDPYLKKLNKFIWNDKITPDAYDLKSKDKLELAELIDLLRKTMEKNKSIEISSTIGGRKQKVNVGSGTVKSLFYHANSELKRLSKGLYEAEFEFNKKIESGLYENFTEPYTKEELDKILKYERSIHKKYSYRKRTQTKSEVQAVVKIFREKGVFKNKEGELTSEEYQFLYDAMAVIGIYEENYMDKLSSVDKKEILRDYVRIRKK